MQNKYLTKILFQHVLILTANFNLVLVSLLTKIFSLSYFSHLNGFSLSLVLVD